MAQGDCNSAMLDLNTVPFNCGKSSKGNITPFIKYGFRKEAAADKKEYFKRPLSMRFSLTQPVKRNAAMANHPRIKRPCMLDQTSCINGNKKRGKGFCFNLFSSRKRVKPSQRNVAISGRTIKRVSQPSMAAQKSGTDIHKGLLAS